jgi:hypothetical protein
MSGDLDHILFVYRCLECKSHYGRYAGEVIRCKCGSKEREHTATVDPRRIIEIAADECCCGCGDSLRGSEVANE